MAGDRRKPRGEVGPITIGPTKGEGGFKPLDLPNTKEAIEEYVVEGVRSTVQKLGGKFPDTFRTQEDDFDFTFEGEHGKRYLELMEIAPLELTGGRYDGSPVSYQQGAMAELVYGRILKKAKKYGSRRNARINLLTYATDWRFQLSKGVLALISFWSMRREHPFESIAYYLPMSPEEGQLAVLYPVHPQKFSQFNESHERNQLILRLDLTKLEVRPGSVEAPLSWPPWLGF